MNHTTLKLRMTRKLLVSLLLLQQLVFLNASELIREFDVHEPVQIAEQFDKDLYARDIPALVATLQQAVEDNEASGGMYTERFSRFNNTENGYNLLHIAALGASVELTELALKIGVNVHSKHAGKRGNTALHLVSGDSWSNRSDERPSHNPEARLVVAKMLLDGWAEVNKMNYDHETPLFCAIRNENIDLVDLFLKHGAKVNFDNFDNEDQPLYRACCYNNVALVKLLLEYGANPFCVINQSYPITRIRSDQQVKARDKKIRSMVARCARNLVPCYGDCQIWNRAIANLETWSNR